MRLVTDRNHHWSWVQLGPRGANKSSATEGVAHQSEALERGEEIGTLTLIVPIREIGVGR